MLQKLKLFLVLFLSLVNALFALDNYDLSNTSKEFAERHIVEMENYYGDDFMYEIALKNDGETTKHRLHSIFEKCNKPNSNIRIGSVGGSITDGAGVGRGNVYIDTLGKFFQKMCPKSAVTVTNAAVSTSGSLTTGLCLETLLGPQLDLLTVDFSLNDFTQYTINNFFSNVPYELLSRNALYSAFIDAPAIYHVFFWGSNFKHKSGQESHLAISEFYDIAGISMRDVAFTGMENGSEMYKDKVTILADKGHHPKTFVHTHLAAIISYHIAKEYLSWLTNRNFVVRSIEKIDPLSKELKRLDLSQSSFECSINRPLEKKKSIVLYEDKGFEFNAKGRCLMATKNEAVALVTVETLQGFVMLSSCRHYGSRLDKPYFTVNIILNDENIENGTKLVRVPLNLQNLIGQIGETYVVDPPLAAGRHTLEIVPNTICKGIDDKIGNGCNGLYAVVTL
mmetsp:Transcript_2378/g.3194  ORF Transcript_2378/g.3194 Transcript_2378/m.3194 type:complete len:451 (+) Transcript_2378:10-1362(+)